MDFIKRTWAEIDLDALDYNIKSIKSKMEPEHKVMGIVKADAYGHGDGFVARKLQAGGFDWFGVSNIEEGMSLRNEGITKPILVLGYTPASCVEILCQQSITNAIVGIEHARSLQEAAAAAAAPATARKLRREIIIRKLSFLYIKNCALQRECAHLHIY